MVICIDVDDVICNLQETVVELFNKRYGANYKLSDFTEYDIMNVLPTQDAIVFRDIYGEPGLYDKVKPMPGAQKALEKLVHCGHQVYLVTAAIPKTYGEKVAFIQRFFPCIDEAHIICMKNKWLLNCDVMIEDKLQTLLNGRHYHRILMNQPWNSYSKDWIYGVNRCNNWDEILEVVNQINEWER
jgi:5'(3')-deoxyribonucleotidase